MTASWPDAQRPAQHLMVPLQFGVVVHHASQLTRAHQASVASDNPLAHCLTGGSQKARSARKSRVGPGALNPSPVTYRPTPPRIGRPGLAEGAGEPRRTIETADRRVP